jgi:hypothetical protein
MSSGPNELYFEVHETVVTPWLQGNMIVVRADTVSEHPSIIIIIINLCKPYLTASAPRLTHWGGGK